MTDQTEFGPRLRAARDCRRMTQEQLASKCGMSVAAISHFETGKREPNLASLRKIADGLGVSADFLLYRESGTGFVSYGALQAIVSERAYQLARYPGKAQSEGGFATIIRQYSRQLDDAFVYSLPPHDLLRKIAATAVAAMDELDLIAYRPQQDITYATVTAERDATKGNQDGQQ